MQIRAFMKEWYSGVTLLARDVRDNNFYYAEPLTIKLLPPGAVIPPLITLTPEETQELMDSLWQCGFRPTEGTGSAGSLCAVEKHLSDMRKIVEAKLKLKL